MFSFYQLLTLKEMSKFREKESLECGRMHMSHFSYTCKMWYLLNLVLESWEYIWSYLTFWVVIADGD